MVKQFVVEAADLFLDIKNKHEMAFVIKAIHEDGKLQSAVKWWLTIF